MDRHSQQSSGLPSHGSRTAVAQAASAPTPPPEGVLRLRGDAQPTAAADATGPSARPAAAAAPRVQWTEDTVDNEYLNKKKSKVCCIFHRQRAFGESDSESSSCSGSDSDGGGPNAYEQVPRNRPRHRHQCHK